MKKDVFSVWLKEFCSLVFTQSVQAFLLATIMSVVMSTADGTLDENRGAVASATGIIAVIALISISKIEVVVKKIFGIENSFAEPSMKNGMAGLAGGLIAAKLAGRVLNNVGKVGSGMAGIRKSKIDEAKANKKHANDLSKLNSRYSDVLDENGNPVELKNNNTSASNENKGKGRGRRKSTASSDLQNNLNRAKDRQEKALDKYDDIISNYNSSLEKAKADRRDGRYKILSGLSESAGALAGGLGGAVVGMAMGDNVAKYTGTGMGVGDYVGEKGVSTIKSTQDSIRDLDNKINERSKAIDSISKLTGDDIKTYKDAVNKLQKYSSAISKQSKDLDKKSNAGNI